MIAVVHKSRSCDIFQVTHLLCMVSEVTCMPIMILMFIFLTCVYRLSGGRSSSQSGSPPGVNREIEPYAQAVVPRHRRTQQAEPTYAIASRASPTRRPSDPRPMPDGDCREVGDEDDAPPVPPKQFDSGEDDGDSSDDGEESKDILEIDVMRTPSVGNGHVAVGALSTAASMCSSRTLVGTCRDQVTLSLTNDGTTLDAPDDAEELGAVFF